MNAEVQLTAEQHHPVHLPSETHVLQRVLIQMLKNQVRPSGVTYPMLYAKYGCVGG
jgi:hypothetical protein